jgi:hypothetical protein
MDQTHTSNRQQRKLRAFAACKLIEFETEEEHEAYLRAMSHREILPRHLVR